MHKFFKYSPPKENCDFDLTFGKNVSETSHFELSDALISPDIDITLNNVNKIVHADVNGDIKIRHFICHNTTDKRKGFLVWLDGLVNSNL